MSLLKINHLKKTFYGSSGSFNLTSSFKSKYLRKKVIDDVSFDLEKGEVLVIAGESGSGKTTLAKIIMGSIIPDKGEIYFLGKNITSLKKDRHFYSMVQMIQQDPYSSLNPYLKVRDIVMEPLKIHFNHLKKSEKEEMIRLALKRTKLEPVQDYLEKYPQMLSGGQRQRVSIARSIITSPKLIIADEPVSMLDVSVRAEILSLLNDLRKNLDISIIYITHDLATSRLIGDKLGILFSGSLVEFGSIDEVLSNPLHPYTWMLIDAINFSSTESKYYKQLKNTTLFDIPDSGCKFYNRCKLSFKQCINNPDCIKINDNHCVSCFYYKNKNI